MSYKIYVKIDSVTTPLIIELEANSTVATIVKQLPKTKHGYNIYHEKYGLMRAPFILRDFGISNGSKIFAEQKNNHQEATLDSASASVFSNHTISQWKGSNISLLC